jgi:hypothetical protein
MCGEPHYKFRHLHRKVPLMAKPGSNGKDRQRCGARVRHRAGFCRKWPVPGKTQCRLHGGLSTGALTEDGKARSLAAMRAGRQRWHEEMRAKKALGEIDRFPGGRKPGAGWVTPRMWERRQMETMQRLRAQREALEPPPPPGDAAAGPQSSRGRRRRFCGPSRNCRSTHPGWRSSPRAAWPGWPRPGANWREGRAGRDRGPIFRSLRVSGADYCPSTARGQGRLSQVRARVGPHRHRGSRWPHLSK